MVGGTDGAVAIADVIAAVADKCGVAPAVLTPLAWSACPHADAAASAPRLPPRALTQQLHAEALKKYEAERVYATEVLGGAAPPPPVAPARLTSDAPAAEVQGVCLVCRTPLGCDHVVLLPGWDVYCRKHARREVLRRATGAAHICITPRGAFSTAYCMQSKRGLEWRGSWDEIGAYPVPEGLDAKAMVKPDPMGFFSAGDGAADEAAAGLDAATAGACVALASLAAAARSWHSLAAPPARWRDHLAVTGIFLPTTGVDPAGLDSPFSLHLYEHMTTGFAVLPHAGVYRRGDAALPHVALDVAGVDGQAVFGFLLFPDEDDLADPAAAAAFVNADGGRAEEEDVLGAKLADLARAFPHYALAPRQVWSTLDEQWVTAIVPHLPPCAADALVTAADHYSPAADLDMAAGDSASDDDDDEDEDGGAYADPMDPAIVTAPDTGRATKAVSTWVQFFLDVYLVARGIGYVGEVARAQEDRRS
eukprot:TRINITY_DN6792_c0_g1_i1.p1 TRINITY_DN6792_c0_g1~~TRINITY_DN6792_c0_g1_i1.p1  ORF type:complete len:478 (+),score=169.93 TRINITY_DN6792_c0_g1_i1:41-1474(+)